MSCTISNIHQTLTYTRLASGPLVKIFVGPKEKLYSVPKDLIAHYSSYFASCFKNNWKEANEGVLRLPDDRPEFFDVLMEYFRHGEAKYAPKGNLDNMEWMEVLKTCFDFIRFTDMYDVIEASAAVKDILSSIFSRHRFDECVLAVGRDGMYFCIGRLPAENQIFKLIANVCVRALLRKGLGHITGDTSVEEINELMRKNNDMSVVMWKQVTTSILLGRHSDWSEMRIYVSQIPL